MTTGQIRVVSSSAQGTIANGSSFHSTISADGQYAAFSSGADNLVAGVPGSFSNIYLKNLTTNAITLVSASTSGGEANGANFNASLSADGRYVAFRSQATNLVSHSVFGNDIYRRDMYTGVVELVSRSTTGSASNGASYLADQPRISADGRKVAFHSAGTNLIGSDTNGSDDVFVRDLFKAGVQQLAGIVVTNSIGAGISLNIVNRYQDELLGYRAALGSTTSRLSSFTSTLSATSLNYESAASRIWDADIAQEAAVATAAQIRQQVGTSLLAQVNLAPQIGLQMLQNAG